MMHETKGMEREENHREAVAMLDKLSWIKDEILVMGEVNVSITGCTFYLEFSESEWKKNFDGIK
jgi:hypothetical protein